MINFEQIILRIKESTGLKKDNEIARILGATDANFSRWKTRNKIPYEQIVDFCLKYDIDIKFILTGKETTIQKSNNINGNNNNIIGNNNNLAPSNNNNKQILMNLEKLPKKRQEYYFHKIGLEVIEQED